MNVAVGRLHVSVTVAQANRRAQKSANWPPSSDAVQKEFDRQVRMKSVDADRERWAMNVHPRFW